VLETGGVLSELFVVPRPDRHRDVPVGQHRPAAVLLSVVDKARCCSGPYCRGLWIQRWENLSDEPFEILGSEDIIDLGSSLEDPSFHPLEVNSNERRNLVQNCHKMGGKEMLTFFIYIQ
jgi:hypothetical protein